MTDQLRKAKQYRWNPDVPLFDGPHLVMAEYWVHGGDLRDDDGGHPFSAAQGERRVVLATDHATAAAALREAQEWADTLDYELMAVMHSVDKWFGVVPDENPATRAADAREIALKAIEEAHERIAALKAEVKCWRHEAWVQRKWKRRWSYGSLLGGTRP